MALELRKRFIRTWLFDTADVRAPASCCELDCSLIALQVMQELKRLLAYYKRETGETPQLLGVALSARKNLCIHPEVR